MVLRPLGAVVAHSTSGFGVLGYSSTLVVYLTLVALGLAAVGLRFAWPTPRFAPAEPIDHAPWPGAGAPTAVGVAFRAAGLGLLAAVVVIAWAGSPALGANPVPIAVFELFWIGGQIVALVLGDLWRLANPFDTMAGVLARARPAGPETGDASETGAGDWWLPATLLASFLWLGLAWSEGIRPRSIAVWITAYTLVMVAGAVAGGRGWVRRNEAFAVLFGTLATASPLDWSGRRPRLRNPLARLAARAGGRREAAVLAVLVGSSVFDAVLFTRWWSDLLGNQSANAYTAWNTAGLVWTILLVAVVWVICARTTAHLAQPGRVELVPTTVLGLAPLLAAMAATFAVTHGLGSLILDGQNLLALLSDPLARGWDLLGTIDLQVDATLIPVAAQAWLELGLVVGVLLATLVLVHDRCLARFGSEAGLRSSWPLTGFLGIAAVVALELLVGV